MQEKTDLFYLGIQKIPEYRIVQKYKMFVIPAVFQRESGVSLSITVSPIEPFGDDRHFVGGLS